ncbi:MAG: hypothetical protein QF689_04540, partial [Candidatus Latescibacteria bacterium]|nr:hypothetical protein [Candidatus Latescibacterota bacterium]
DREIDYHSFELSSLTPHIGAEIRGIDLSKSPSAEEEAELNRQIDARWSELKESDATFAPPPSSGEGVDGILDQVDGLRRTLEGQDERAKIYADIVRLQNMKIDAMTEEISRLRKG